MESEKSKLHTSDALEGFQWTVFILDYPIRSSSKGGPPSLFGTDVAFSIRTYFDSPRSEGNRFINSPIGPRVNVSIQVNILMSCPAPHDKTPVLTNLFVPLTIADADNAALRVWEEWYNKQI